MTDPVRVSGEEECPRRRSDVRGCNLDGETVLLDRDRGLIHHLNETASFVWARCDGHLALTEIADQLGEAFEVDADTARQDVGAAVAQFRALHLLGPGEERDRRSGV